MVMHFSMLVIEQMWSELSRMEGGKKKKRKFISGP